MNSQRLDYRLVIDEPPGTPCSNYKCEGACMIIAPFQEVHRQCDCLRMRI